jgi:hypothetical protein
MVFRIFEKMAAISQYDSIAEMVGAELMRLWLVALRLIFGGVRGVSPLPVPPFEVSSLLVFKPRCPKFAV